MAEALILTLVSVAEGHMARWPHGQLGFGSLVRIGSARNLLHNTSPFECLCLLLGPRSSRPLVAPVVLLCGSSSQVKRAPTSGRDDRGPRKINCILYLRSFLSSSVVRICLDRLFQR